LPLEQDGAVTVAVAGGCVGAGAASVGTATGATGSTITRITMGVAVGTGILPGGDVLGGGPDDV
jgi:hypothetical protein